MGSILGFHLPLPDRVHYFDAGQDDAGATKILDAPHRSGDAFDDPMITLCRAIQVLDFTNLDGAFPARRSPRAAWPDLSRFFRWMVTVSGASSRTAIARRFDSKGLKGSPFVLAMEIAARTLTRMRSNLKTIARAGIFNPFFGSKLE
jgi:hypothetical protein